MSAEDTSPRASSSQDDTAPPERGRLGFFLCWAVVFADIGTSVYYTPGILFGQVGKLAGFFVTLTMAVFLLLTMKYAEVTYRYPQGGGVVTVAANAMRPWVGALGGMLILVDYFLTAAISALSGLTYFAVVLPQISPLALPMTLVVLGLLGLLNWWGVSDSAMVSLVGALIAFLSDLAIVFFVVTHVPFQTMLHIIPLMFSGKPLTGLVLLTGFAGSFLAFSGLESISQLSPVMKPPRKRTGRLALLLVVVTVGITSPLLTIFATTLVDASQGNPNQLISLLGGQYGGTVLEIEVAVSASALLIFASNTAIIGCYHVFLALSRMHFFPHFVQRRGAWRGTPHYSIALATGIPMLVLLLARLVSGSSQNVLNVLGDLYAFGLLGAFSLTCLGLDIVRFRERRQARARQEQRRPVRVGAPNATSADVPEHAYPLRYHPAVAPVSRLIFVLGVLTTALIMVAWSTNLVFKPLATAFGGGVTVIGLLIAYGNHRSAARRGRRLVFTQQIHHPIPGSVLAVLPPTAANQEAVIRAACAEAHHNVVVFLYRGQIIRKRPLRPFEIVDPYLEDDEAKRTFAAAESIAREEEVQRRYVYLPETPEVVSQFWQLLRPRDTLLSEEDREAAHGLAPDRVLHIPGPGDQVGHYIKEWHTPASG
jgi:amino acid transporter